jgi:CHAD domain-containing protein
MLNVQSIEKSVCELRKILKRFPADLGIEDVHALRTQVRRAESLLAALSHGQGDKFRRLLGRMADLRRAAGYVRDMDVLESKAMTLANEENADIIIWLVEHLGQTRMKNAGRLNDRIAYHRNALRHGLKDVLSLVEKDSRSQARAAADRSLDSAVATNVRRAALSLVADITHWPALDRNNIHDFRLKVKELRSLLQLNPSSYAGLVEALGQSKDMIGEWHDWHQLSKTAAKVLGGNMDRSVLMQIDRMREQKLQEAMASTNAMRTCYFVNEITSKQGNRDLGFPLHIPATGAAMKLLSN